MGLRHRFVEVGAGSFAKAADSVDRRRALLQARQHELRRLVGEGDQTGARIDALEVAVREIRAETSRTARALERLAAATEAAMPSMQAHQQAVSDVAEDVRAVHLRLQDTQMLVAKVRDDLAGNEARIERARAHSDYDAAWEDEHPLITVRIPTFQNGQQLAERVLPTLLAQTYPHWECVIVGDAVTDDTGERIAALDDDRIRFENLAVRGPYPEHPARRRLVAGTAPANTAAAAARGAWIAPLDHDDEFALDHLEVLLARARETRAEFVYGQLEVRDADTGMPAGPIVGRFPPEHGQIGLQGAIYHAGFQREGLALDPYAWQAGEPGDWNLVRRLWEAGARFAFVDRPVTTYYLPAQLRQ